MSADLRQRLRAHDIRPRKGLSQNFLTNPQAVQNVVGAAGLQPGDTVVEVGAGPGVLTPHLAERALRVVAVELDERMLPLLGEAMAGRDNIEVHHGDILDFDPAGLPASYVVVANLPYHLTSRVIRQFLEAAHRPRRMTVTVQAEVAERIAAKPPRMSLLAVSVQLYGQPNVVASIPPEDFWPAPEVTSAVLRIDRIGDRLAATLDGLSEADFFRVVRAGFAEKRKQLHNTLAHHLSLNHPEAVALMEQAGIEPQRRAETMEVSDWVKLAKRYVER